MGLWWMSGSLVAPCNVWWVGEPIWVLGVAATWVSGWGFWVNDCRGLPRFGYGCRGLMVAVSGFWVDGCRG